MKEESTFNKIPFTESKEEENANIDAICQQLVYGKSNKTRPDRFVQEKNDQFIQHQSCNDLPPQLSRFSIKVFTRSEIIEDTNDGIGFEIYDEIYTYNYHCKDDDVISITIEDERVNLWNEIDEDDFEN